jgi:hypothetical protein
VPEPDVPPKPLKIVRLKQRFKLPNSNRLLTDIEPLPSKQDEPVQTKPTLEVIPGSSDQEQKSVQRATSVRRILAHWPWAWLALAGVVTIAWSIALCWAAFAYVQWIVD